MSDITFVEALLFGFICFVATPLVLFLIGTVVWCPILYLTCNWNCFQ